MPLDIISLGEPLLEFNAVTPGSLREVRSYEVGYGGDTSNYAVAASRLGARAGYICKLGGDDFGQVFMDLWQAEGVDTSHVRIEEESSTGIYFISRRGGTHSFTYYRKDSAASHLAPRDLDPEYIASARVLHTSGITQAISNSACDAAFAAIELARKSGTLVSYDPNVRLKLWSAHRARSVVLETLSLCDFAFPSLEDAQFLGGKDAPEEVARWLLARGPRVVVLKLAGQGSLVATREGIERVEPYRVEVVDATGAGDCFDAAFMVAHLRGLPLRDCARFANAAAALTTTGWGAVNPIPRRERVEALLEQGAPVATPD